MNVFSIIKAGVKLCCNSNYRFLFFADKGIYNNLTDEEYIKKRFRATIGSELDLKNPVTYNEKLQWLKLYDRNPLYTELVDKIKVKDYVSNIIGKEYIIPTIGVWDTPDEIDFDCLPEKFVLKCNHNSGLGMYICTNKSQMKIRQVKKDLWKGLKEDKYLTSREWPYKNVKRRILAEKYMEDKKSSDANQILKDYKLMCFNGKCQMSFVCTDRFSRDGVKVTFYDRGWNEMPFERFHEKSKVEIEKPTKYTEMLLLAEKLSQNIPFLRVDFYEVNEKIYFGELTFYPGSGFEPFSPDEWDKKLGNMIELTK